jgi:cytidylate kinase
MNTEPSFDKYLTYIGTQLGPGGKVGRSRGAERRPPAITISREAGAGGIPVAERLADYLRSHGPKTERPWTVFDKNLVEQVLTDHSLPREVARYMPEDRISQIRDMVEEALGLHPSSWTLLRQTTETILHLAELGNVILVGRAANVITVSLENVFHVRLIGSLEVRVKLIQDYFKLSRKTAAACVKKEDSGRKRYLRRHFHRNVDDPLLYHVIINTDRFSFDETTRLIGDAVLRRFYGAT